MSTPRQMAIQLLATLAGDLPTLHRIDRYVRGEHDDPYMPDTAGSEYRLLAKRSVSNWMPLLVKTPCQALYVDSFRRGQDVENQEIQPAVSSPEWRHWQGSRLDARQAAVYEGAVTYGHSFTVTLKTRVGNRETVRTKGLSPLRTAALFEDAANDDVPVVALTVKKWPISKSVEGGDPVITPGVATMWDDIGEYEVRFNGMEDPDSVRVEEIGLHGADECPVTRFAAAVDLDGRTMGVIEPMIALQDRINQTIFDLLVDQTYNSHQVRYATGMAPPLQMRPVRDEDGEITEYVPVVDSSGKPVPERINHNASRFLFAPDADVKFGTLEASPLEGFIASVDMSIRHLSAISQTPPHYLLGQIANLSAEALGAAETALSRKTEAFRKMFGEAWERVFVLAAKMLGEDVADDHSGEVVWRDMEQRSLAQSADALGKLRDTLGVPARGLWQRIPNVTANELSEWERLSEEEDPTGLLADALTRSGATNRPDPLAANEAA